MELILWNTSIVVSKAIFYFGFASIVGFAFLMHKPAENRTFCKHVVYHLVPVLVLSLFASAAWFFAKTGAFSESGLQGVFDPVMLEVMWDSPVGDVALASRWSAPRKPCIMNAVSRYPFHTLRKT